MEKWWNQTVFYQIYMPSFCDGNGDGIGDFRGITKRLEYLKELGVGGIWLTPFYSSPKIDNGYDISDYYQIDSDYGTMEEFECFIQKAHTLGIRVIADMVINHTSTEHSWFVESKSSVFSEKRDWYLWKKPVSGKEPNNWESFFGEKAWEFDLSTGEYYYHSFAKEQADLNWSNENVKNAVFQMLEFWIEKGVDGFRFDVINNLTLTEEFKDNPADENGKQIHQYDVNQPGIHEFLKELRLFLDQRKELFLVGEISSDQLELIHSYLGEEELHTTFNFNLGSRKDFEFQDFYQEVQKMNQLYQSNEKPTLFFGSHDMGRFPSRFLFSQDEIKGLLTFMMCYDGIPFLYFGDEIGMKSLYCRDISEARDIQGIIAYQKAVKEGKTIEESIDILNLTTRDKSRNVMQWDCSGFGGFSTHTPWISCGEEYLNCNVRSQREEEESVFHYSKKLISLRSKRRVLTEGSCTVTQKGEGIFLCIRELEGEKIAAVINFSDTEAAISEFHHFTLILGTNGVDFRVDLQTHQDFLYLPPKGSGIIAALKD